MGRHSSGIFLRYYSQYKDILIKTQTLRPSSICERKCETVKTGAPGRPPFYTFAENLEDLRGIGFSWKNIA